MNPFEKLEQYSINKLKQELADYKVNYFLQYHITGKLGEFSYVPIVERNMWELWQTGSALSQAEFSLDNDLAEFAKDNAKYGVVKINVLGKISRIEVTENNRKDIVSSIESSIRNQLPLRLSEAQVQATIKKAKVALEDNTGRETDLKGVFADKLPQMLLDRKRQLEETKKSVDKLTKETNKRIEEGETKILVTPEERAKLDAEAKAKKQADKQRIREERNLSKEQRKQLKGEELLQEAQEGTFHQSAYVSQRVNALAKIFNERNVDTADLNEKEVKEKINLLSTTFKEEKNKGDYVSLKAKLQLAFGNRNKNDRKNDLIKRLSGENPSKELTQVITEFVESPKDAFTKDALISLYRNNSRNDLADKLNNNLFKSYALNHSIYKGANEQGTQVDRFIVTELNAIRAVNTVLNSNARYFKWDVSDEHRRRGVICPVCYERSVRGYLNDGVYPRDMILRVTELHIPKHPYCLCKWTPLDDSDLTVKAINRMSSRTREQTEQGFGDWEYVSNNWSKLAPVAKGLLLASISMAGLWFAVSKYRLRKSSAVANVTRGVKDVTRGRVDVDDIAEEAIKYDKDKGTMIIKRPKTEIEKPDGTITTVGNLILPVTEKVDGDTVLGDNVTNPSTEEAKGLTLGQKLENEVKGTNKAVRKDLVARVDEEGGLTTNENVGRLKLLERIEEEQVELVRAYEEDRIVQRNYNYLDEDIAPDIEIANSSFKLSDIDPRLANELNDELPKESNITEAINFLRTVDKKEYIDSLNDMDLEELQTNLQKAINTLTSKETELIATIKRGNYENEQEILLSSLRTKGNLLNLVSTAKNDAYLSMRFIKERKNIRKGLTTKNQFGINERALEQIKQDTELLDVLDVFNKTPLRSLIKPDTQLFSDIDTILKTKSSILNRKENIVKQKRNLEQELRRVIKLKNKFLEEVNKKDIDYELLTGKKQPKITKEVEERLWRLSEVPADLDRYIRELQDELDVIKDITKAGNLKPKTLAKTKAKVAKVKSYIENLPSNSHYLKEDDTLITRIKELENIEPTSTSEAETLGQQLLKLYNKQESSKLFSYNEFKQVEDILDTINSNLIKSDEEIKQALINRFSSDKKFDIKSSLEILNRYKRQISSIDKQITELENNVQILNNALLNKEVGQDTIKEVIAQIKYLEKRKAYYTSYKQRILNANEQLSNLKREGLFLSKKDFYSFDIDNLSFTGKTRAKKIQALKNQLKLQQDKLKRKNLTEEEINRLSSLVSKLREELRKTEIAEFRRYESNSNYLRYISATSNVLFSPIFKYMK